MGAYPVGRSIACFAFGFLFLLFHAQIKHLTRNSKVGHLRATVIFDRDPFGIVAGIAAGPGWISADISDAPVTSNSWSEDDEHIDFASVALVAVGEITLGLRFVANHIGVSVDVGYRMTGDAPFIKSWDGLSGPLARVGLGWAHGQSTNHASHRIWARDR